MKGKIYQQIRSGLAGAPGFILFASAVTLAYFGPFLHNYFVFDDFSFIEHILQGPRAVLLGYNNILRLIPNAIWWPLYALFDLNPLGYNLLPITLYLVNAILLYFFLFKLTGDRLLAFMGGSFFVASGAGVDAVFWRSANATPLNLCFFLLTLYFHLAYRQSGSGKYRLLALLAFLLAMFCKEEAASLPFIIILLETLYLDRCRSIWQLLRRAAPYAAIIIFYLLVNYLVIYFMVRGGSELVKNSSFRPLYSLFAGWTVFFISPDGVLEVRKSLLCLAALLVPASFLFVRDRKLLCLGYLWVFFTFLPQSLSTLASFQPRVLVNSISRYLYLPSIGSALVFAALVLAFRERLSARMQLAVCFLCLAAFIAVQYPRVHDRGEKDWQFEGIKMSRYVRMMKSLIPGIPGKSYVYITAPPEGRAFTQQSLRAIYRNPEIRWKNDPDEIINLEPGAHEYFIDYDWGADLYDGVPGRIIYIR
jgi:hypothetical protein